MDQTCNSEWCVKLEANALYSQPAELNIHIICLFNFKHRSDSCTIEDCCTQRVVRKQLSVSFSLLLKYVEVCTGRRILDLLLHHNATLLPSVGLPLSLLTGCQPHGAWGFYGLGDFAINLLTARTRLIKTQLNSYPATVNLITITRLNIEQPLCKRLLLHKTPIWSTRDRHRIKAT